MFNGFNGTQNCNHLVCLAKWLSVRLWTKWLWIQIPLQSMKPQISRLFRARRSLTFRKLSLFINKIVLITTSSTFLHLKNAPKYQCQFTIDGCHGYHGFADIKESSQWFSHFSFSQRVQQKLFLTNVTLHPMLLLLCITQVSHQMHRKHFRTSLSWLFVRTNSS